MRCDPTADVGNIDRETDRDASYTGDQSREQLGNQCVDSDDEDQNAQNRGYDADRAHTSFFGMNAQLCTNVKQQLLNLLHAISNK